MTDALRSLHLNQGPSGLDDGSIKHEIDGVTPLVKKEEEDFSGPVKKEHVLESTSGSEQSAKESVKQDDHAGVGASGSGNSEVKQEAEARINVEATDECI